MGRLEHTCAQLLDACEFTDRHESLVGDLLEERALGRSRLWFLREVLLLFILGISRQIASDRLRSLLAVLLGLTISIPLLALLKTINTNAGWGSGQLTLMAIVVFVLTGMAIRHKFPHHAVAMAAAFAAYALLAKLSLLAMNCNRIQSTAHPAQFPILAAEAVGPPLFAIIGALAVRQYTPPGHTRSGTPDAN